MKTKILRNENRTAAPPRRPADVPVGQGKPLVRGLIPAVGWLIALAHHSGLISELGLASR
jgi:hypothetical protein